MDHRNTILIIAGPNGAGKSTFAKSYLADKPRFIAYFNADAIARGYGPIGSGNWDIKAGKEMLRAIKSYARAGKTFAFETTLSGKGYLRMIDAWRADGYRVELHFLSLPSADYAMVRVKSRVASGGHHIPEDVIRRRFDAGLRNFHDLYRARVDLWRLYDSSVSRTLKLLSEGGLNMKEQETRIAELDHDENLSESTRLANEGMFKAMKLAHKMAHQTGTKLVVQIDGEMRLIDPDPAFYGDVPDIPPQQF
ncbi:MAG: AAA family ATPase [bacterium]